MASTASRPPASGRPGNPQARAQRREQILAGAFRCFVRKGFHAATTAEISAEAGVSVANLYQYFPAKDDLIKALVQADLATDLELIRMVDAADTLAEGLEQTTRLLVADPDLLSGVRLRLEIVAEAARNSIIAEEVRRADAQMVEAIVQLFLRRQRAGEVRKDISPETAAELILSMYDGLAGRLAFGGGDPAVLARAADQMILASLGVVPTPAD
jgi:TetR/AcrR family transcriptional repressor of uid operon